MTKTVFQTATYHPFNLVKDGLLQVAQSVRPLDIYRGDHILRWENHNDSINHIIRSETGDCSPYSARFFPARNWPAPEVSPSGVPS